MKPEFVWNITCKKKKIVEQRKKENSIEDTSRTPLSDSSTDYCEPWKNL